MFCAISPNIRRSTNPGTGAHDGRCTARPIALANSRLETDSGATALIAPLTRFVLDRPHRHSHPVF